MFDKPISRKGFLSGTAAVVAGLGLAACSGESGNDSSKSGAGKTYGSGKNGTVYWLNFKP